MPDRMSSHSDTITTTAPAVRLDQHPPRWLDATEQHAWQQFTEIMLKLPSELETQLQHDAEMTHFEYRVTALLSAAPDRTLRLSKLATQANASPSRLSHVVSRLENRGWTERQPCPDDARATLAVLTDDGSRQFLAAAPGHLATVRKLVFDALDPHEVDQLTRLCTSILARIDAT